MAKHSDCTVLQIPGPCKDLCLQHKIQPISYHVLTISDNNEGFCNHLQNSTLPYSSASGSLNRYRILMQRCYNWLCHFVFFSPCSTDLTLVNSNGWKYKWKIKLVYLNIGYDSELRLWKCRLTWLVSGKTLWIYLIIGRIQIHLCEHDFKNLKIVVSN